MKNICLFLMHGLLILPVGAAAADNLLSGARAAAMANATVAIYDFWAISHNQAGMAGITALQAGIYAENRFMLQEMSLAATAVVLPSHAGHFGLSMQYFGSSLYKEGKVGLAYSRKFGDKLAAGIQLNYMFTRIGEGYGSSGTACAEAGIIYELLPNLQIGAHIFNPTKAVLKTENYHGNEEFISTIIRSGMAYDFSNKVLLSIEVEKDIRHEPVTKLGIEYRAAEFVYVRAGISTNPVLNAFGFGLHTGRLQIDISASYHYILGYSPQAGIIYSFQ